MDAIEDIVKSYDKNIVLKEKQRDALLHLASEKGDLIVSLPVGYGKSLIFHVLPQILRKEKANPVVLVVSPLNIIQKDQCQSLRQHNISCCRLDIEANLDVVEENVDAFKCQSDAKFVNVEQGKFQVILCHPEALLNTSRGKQLLKSDLPQHVVAVVIDECHIIEKW